MNRLFGVGCCQGSPDQRSGDCQEVTIQHSFTSTQHPALNHHPWSIRLLIRSSIYSFIQCPFIHLPLHVISIHHSVCPSIHPVSTHSSIHSTSIHSSIYPSNHPIVFQSIHLFKRLSFPSIHSFRVQIHPSIHPLFIHLFIIYPLK